jgi:phosphoserine phosphatase
MARPSRRRTERWVAACERSSLTHREFARRHGLKVRTLRSWIYRLRREAPEARVLPVRVAEGTRGGVEIVLASGVLVRLASGTPAEEVAAIARALG